MRIEVDESAFWIMTCLSIWRVRLAEFGWDLETFEDSCNLTFPEALRYDRISQVNRLRHQGLVDVHEEPLPFDLRNSNFDDPCVYVSLTALGCKTWETVSRANWDAYVEVSVNFLEGNISETILTCINADRLNKYLHVWQKWEMMMGEPIPIEGTEVLSTVLEWEPTYWKTIPSASQVTYRSIEENDEDRHQFTPKDPAFLSKISDELKALDEWYSVPEEFPQIINLSDD